MAKVGGQDRPFALRVVLGPVPAHEGVRGKSVPHVVETRTMTVGRATETNLPTQRVERSMNIAAVQPMALAGDEHEGGHRALPPMALASAQVVGEHLAGRGVQGNQTTLAEL